MALTFAPNVDNAISEPRHSFEKYYLLLSLSKVWISPFKRENFGTLPFFLFFFSDIQGKALEGVVENLSLTDREIVEHSKNKTDMACV